MATPEPSARRAAAEQAILTAASELLEEGNTLASLSVEQIAARAGMGRTGFYVYFRDKRDLLMRLTRDVVGELYAEADRWWQGEADLRESLRRVVTIYLEHCVLLRVVVESAALDEEVRDFWGALMRRFMDATRDRIERDQRAGTAVEIPPAETASALVWMCERSLYQFCLATPDGDAGALTEALFQVFSRAMYGRMPA